MPDHTTDAPLQPGREVLTLTRTHRLQRQQVRITVTAGRTPLVNFRLYVEKSPDRWTPVPPSYRGFQLRPDELRQVAAALTALADEHESRSDHHV